MTQLSASFPKTHRLSGRDAFRRVFDQGTQGRSGPITVRLLANGLAHPRLGLSIGRRFGKAHDRVRLKRCLREAYRHLRHDLPAADLVVTVGRHTPRPAIEYRAWLQKAVRRAVADSRLQPDGEAATMRA
jgi:ribonuclease P protein component